MKRSKLTRRILLVAIAACLICCATTEAERGGKGGGGGGGGGGDGAGQNGGGVIYFSYEGDLYTMKDDGSAVTHVAGFPAGFWPEGEPSRQLHNEKRWFPQRSTVLDANGNPRDDLVVLSDAGDVVELGLAPDLEFLGQVKWEVGDAFVSWVGRRWDIDLTTGDLVVVEGGLYESQLTFDSSENIDGANPPSLLVELPLVYSDGGWVFPHSFVPDIRSHDWGPQGNRFVYETLSREKLVIAAAVLDEYGGWTGAWTFQDILSDGLAVWAPRWSPAGDKLMIRYTESKHQAGVWVMNIDGSGLTMLEAYRTSSQPEVGIWSPTGSHLLYRHLDHMRVDSYIVRAGSNGRGKTRITDKSMGAGFWSAWPLGWRE